MRSIRLPIACAVLLVVLKLREATWNWLPAWAFWLVALVLVLAGVVLMIRTLRELVRLVRKRQARPAEWLSTLLALALLVWAFRAMR